MQEDKIVLCICLIEDITLEIKKNSLVKFQVLFYHKNIKKLNFHPAFEQN